MYLSWHMGWNLVDSRDTRWIKICPLGSGSAFTEVMKWLLATASVVFSMRYMWDWVRPSVIQQQRLQLHIHATHKTVSRQFYVTCSPNKDCVVCGRPLQGRCQNLSGFVEYSLSDHLLPRLALLEHYIVYCMPRVLVALPYSASDCVCACVCHRKIVPISLIT